MNMIKKLETLEKWHATLGAEIAELRSALEPEPEEWRPKKADKYSFVWSHGETGTVIWNNDFFDCGRQQIGNVFRTQEEAEARADLLRWLAADPARWRKIAVLREMMAFSDGEVGNNHYRIIFDTRDNLFVQWGDTNAYGMPVFASEERAHECIAAIGEERIKRDWFGVTG